MKTRSVLLTVFGIAAAAAAFWLWTPDLDRAALERTYLAHPSDMIDLDGTPLHVRESGPADAPAIVMIHGFGASLHTWEPWARALSETHRVVRFDLPGSGLSPPDVENDYSDARVLRIMIRLMEARNIARAVLIGHSIGGRIAWRFAHAHPARVDRLVLIAPDGFASPGFEYGAAPEISAVTGLMRYALPRSLLRSQLAGSYGDPSALSPQVVDRYHDLMRAPGSRGALIERLKQTVLTDPRPALKKIKAPVLLIWGREDALIPWTHAQDYLDHLPSARLESFSGLGHVPHEEAPSTTLPPVKAFLSSR